MATGAPPSIYENMAAMGGGNPTAPAAGGPQAGAAGADGEIVQAVAKIFSVLNKLAKMKPDAAPYVQRSMDPLKEMVVDVLKKDPKDLENAGGGDTPAPAPGDATPPAASAPAAGAAVPA